MATNEFDDFMQPNEGNDLGFGDMNQNQNTGANVDELNFDEDEDNTGFQASSDPFANAGGMQMQNEGFGNAASNPLDDYTPEEQEKIDLVNAAE